MEVSAKQLRVQPGRIISIARSGQDVTVTYRGKPSVKIISITKNNFLGKNENLKIEDEAFGLWKNRKDIGDADQFVRNIRKGRQF